MKGHDERGESEANNTRGSREPCRGEGRGEKCLWKRQTEREREERERERVYSFPLKSTGILFPGDGGGFCSSRNSNVFTWSIYHDCPEMTTD